MKKIYKYSLTVIILSFLAYHSVYFEKLSERRVNTEAEFDFQAYADSIYYQGMLKSENAVELSTLLSAIETDAEAAFEQYGNRLGIGNSAYFMVQYSGPVKAINEESILLISDDMGDITINTRYIFGNALRDASQLVQLTDFKTNAEFNKVSEALNALIRKQVMPPIVEQLQVGDAIEVVGAIKLSKKQLDDPALVITPAQITSKTQ